MRALNDAGIETERPIDVVIWTNEEGSRFAPAMVSAGVFSGVYTLEYGLSRTDGAGRTIGEELARIGYAGAEPVGGYPVHAAYELHIEQGAILERAGKTIGVVTAGQGQRWYEVTLTGVDAHAGTTPMEFRRDALVGAARMISFVEVLGRRYAPYARATVGMIEARPNSRNTVPGGCFFTVEFRHPDDAVLDELTRRCARNLHGWPTKRASVRRSSRSSRMRRSRSRRAASTRCVRRRRRSGCRTWISCPARVMTRAMSRASRRRG